MGNKARIFIIGASGIIAQIVVFRELLVSFYGNELTLGIILSSWIAAELLGAFIFGKAADTIKEKAASFIALQAAYITGFFLSLYAARGLKSLFSLAAGEGAGVGLVLAVSILAMLPVGLSHGALFACACSWRERISSVYVWETIGTIAGSIILTYLFLPRLSSFQIFFLVALVNLAVCIVALPGARRSWAGYGAVFCLILSSLFVYYAATGIPHVRLLKVQWPDTELREYYNSPYGNIAVGERKGQYTFFYNGLPVLSAPGPDEFFIQEQAHLPLLFHPYPRDILVIGGGAGGLLYEAGRHPLRTIAYAEPDPFLIEVFRRHPAGVIEKELSDPRLRIVGTDARYFLRANAKAFDVILLNCGAPSVLSSNRFFTEEFFRLARASLKPSGLLAFSLPGSPAYLSSEMRDMNACISNALRRAFKYVRVLPAERNIFIASDDQQVLTADALLIEKRMQIRPVSIPLFTGVYLEHRFHPSHLGRYNTAMEKATGIINRDARPYAVFSALLWWNSKFSPPWKKALEACGKLRFAWLLFFSAAAVLLLYPLLRLHPAPQRFAIGYSVATGGFFGMLIDLALIFVYQTGSGYLYRDMGVLVSTFMAGIAIGGFIGGSSENTATKIKLLIGSEFVSVLLCLIIGFLAGIPGSAIHRGFLLLLPLLFAAGICTGIPFSLASGIFLAHTEGPGRVAGSLYSLDLLGAWIAGITAGIFLLPVFGIGNACLLAALCKAGSLGLLVLSGRKR